MCDATTEVVARAPKKIVVKTTTSTGFKNGLKCYNLHNVVEQLNLWACYTKF